LVSDDLAVLKQLMLDDGFTENEWNEVINTPPDKIIYDRFNDRTLLE
jgi:hypothetical protein